jgi:hypothetical protein
VAYEILVIAFGVGVWLSADRNRWLHFVGGLLVMYGLFNAYWPPMHQREVIAAGGGTLTDTLHLVWAGITVSLMFVYIAFGAAALGKRFRWYLIITIALLLTFGLLTVPVVGGTTAGQPTQPDPNRRRYQHSVGKRIRNHQPSRCDSSGKCCAAQFQVTGIECVGTGSAAGLFYREAVISETNQRSRFANEKPARQVRQTRPERPPLMASPDVRSRSRDPPGRTV